MRVSMDCMPSWAKNVPLRAPASPAQFSDCSPRTAGPQPHDVLRLALRRGEASEGGRSPPPSYLPAKRRHDLSGKAGELLDHDLSRRPDVPADHDVVEPRIPLLDLLQVGDDVSGRPAEPRAIAYTVLQGGRGRRLRLAGHHGLHVLFAVAQHAQRGHDLGVLFEVRPRLLHRSIRRLVDAHPEAEDQVLSERELSTVAARRLLVVAEPALDELFGGRRDDALDAVPGHEV